MTAPRTSREPAWAAFDPLREIYGAALAAIINAGNPEDPLVKLARYAVDLAQAINAEHAYPEDAATRAAEACDAIARKAVRP